VNRRLTVTTEVHDNSVRSRILDAIAESDVLRRHEFVASSHAGEPWHVSFQAAPHPLSDRDIEHIAQLFTRLANDLSCEFQWYVASRPPSRGLPGAGSVCTLHPNNEMDQKVLRAFLWELLGDV